MYTHASTLFIFSSETAESSDGELGGGLNDLDAHLTVGNNIAHTTFPEDMPSLGSTSTEPSDDECDPIADSDCTLESPLTNPDEREIVTAILEALNLVDQMQGSHKDFVDVLEFAEKLYSRNYNGEQPGKYMWPKSWRETEMILKNVATVIQRNITYAWTSLTIENGTSC